MKQRVKGLVAKYIPVFEERRTYEIIVLSFEAFQGPVLPTNQIA